MRQTISPLGAPRDPTLAPFGAMPSHGGKIRAVWAQHLDEVRAAQRLRYQVFAHEMGARLDAPLTLPIRATMWTSSTIIASIFWYATKNRGKWWEPTGC